ncbi:MAG: LCP family protein [Chloroflexota bacterium]
MQIQQPPHAMRHRSRPRHWSRARGCMASLFIGILLAVCSCIGSLALYIVLPIPPTNVVVMGLDSRGNEGMTTRSDSIIVVGVQPSQLDVSMMSIPRDIFISVPNYGLQRINTINVLGELETDGRGAILLAESIETSFNIGVDRYVRLDFQAFIALVDAVGGITIDVPNVVVDNAFPTPDYGTITVRFEQGVQQMDGERALIYARTRHQDDDYRRAERQQQVITALSQKLANPMNWIPAWVAIQSNMDTNMTIMDIALMIPPIIVNAGDYNQLVINRDYIIPSDGYVIPNYNALQQYLNDNYR